MTAKAYGSPKIFSVMSGKAYCAPKPVVVAAPKPADCNDVKDGGHSGWSLGHGGFDFGFKGFFKVDCKPAAPVKSCEKPVEACKPAPCKDKHDRDDHDDGHDSHGNGHDSHGHGYGSGHHGHKGHKDRDDDHDGEGCGGGGGGGGGTGGGCDPAAPVTVSKGTGNADSLVGTTGNDSIEGLHGNDTLNGGDGVDVLIGGAGTDVLNGGACADTLSGGDDVDVLTGGDGADTFLFDTAFNEDVSDLVMDFTVGTDKIAVAQSLTNIATQGAIDATIFTMGSAGISSDDRFILDEINGILYYDADGDGDSPNLQVATFAAGTTVTAGDIVIV
jgi:Ca2+-binding RTX toxin-like protein